MPWKKLIGISIFAVAMGLLECAVVIYLRKIYYPEGFAFPLRMADGDIAITELLRELATLVMLLSIGWLAGRNQTERFGWFLYSFAVWDIFYYIFLKILIGWPESMLTWDILFLIPLLWTGPVIAPLINAVTMIILSLIIFQAQNGTKTKPITQTTWILLICGSLVTITSYTAEYGLYLFKQFNLPALFDPENPQKVLDYTALFIPVKFPWIIFWAGEAILLVAVYLTWSKK